VEEVGKVTDQWELVGRHTRKWPRMSCYAHFPSSQRDSPNKWMSRRGQILNVFGGARSYLWWCRVISVVTRLHISLYNVLALLIMRHTSVYKNCESINVRATTYQSACQLPESKAGNQRMTTVQNSQVAF
jgi:hypothetical protein